MDALEIRGQRAEVIAKAKELADRDEMSEEERAQIDELLAEADGMARDIERVERVALLEQEARAPQGRKAPAQNKLPMGEKTEEDAFAHYLRTGDDGGLREWRAYNNTDMNIGTAADGGYAVPTGLYNRIVARRDETMLRATLGCTPIPGVGTTVRVAVDNEADVLFTAVTEANSIGQDAPALYYKDFTLAKYAKYLTFSWELLRDETANLMEFISDWIGRGVAATHNSLLITEALASGTAALTLDGAAAVAATEIPELVGKLAPEYQPGAQWILNPTTVAYLQGLSGNAFYFAPMSQGYAGRPTLWGFPVNSSSYASAIAASAKSLLFGNFAFMGYRESTTLTVLRDPYTGAGTGQTKLWFWFDVVYGVLQAEAIDYATHPTA